MVHAVTPQIKNNTEALHGNKPRKTDRLTSKKKWHFMKILKNALKCLENWNSALIVFHLLQWNLKNALL